METTEKCVTHTPGPWQSKRMNKKLYVQSKVTAGWIAEMQPAYAGNPPLCTSEANARLIAAAPELLEACEKTHRILEIMLETINSYKSLEDFREYAAAVVASTRDLLVPAITKAQP